VKQERRRVAEAGVTFERRRGHAITSEDWDFFYRRYQQTYREHQSTPYLSREFFERIGAALPDNMLLVIGSRNGRRICAALGLHDGETLWDATGHPRIRLRPALRSLLLPVHRALHRAWCRAIEGGARRTSSRADRRWPPHSLHVIGDPGLRPPSPTGARANASTSRTRPANSKASLFRQTRIADQLHSRLSQPEPGHDCSPRSTRNGPSLR
jgi:predicted N-acyltransferase